MVVTAGMASNKFVVKCGKFAVLVELHILPQGTSKDTSWFSDHQKEEVSLMLREAVELRVKQLLESRKQHGQSKQKKEFTQSNPLYIKGEKFRVAGYFMKRHINLRCILKEQHRELRVFPDRFVVCMSPNEARPINWTSENQTLDGKAGSGFSEYFAGCTEDKEKLNVSVTVQKKEDTLKHIVKNTKSRMDKVNKPETSHSVSQVCHSSVGSKAADGVKVLGAEAGPSPAAKDRHAEQAEYYIEAVQSGSWLPVLELKTDIGERQPDEDSSQQQPHSMDQLNTGLQNKDPACSGESALPNPKQCEGATSVHSKRRRRCSEEEIRNAKRALLGEDKATPIELTVKMNPITSLMQTTIKKSPSQSNLCFKQDLAQTTSDEELLTFGKFPLRPLLMKNNIEQTNQNKPTTNREKLSLVPISSHSKIKCRPSENVFQEKKEGIENVPRKLKLQRQKKS